MVSCVRRLCGWWIRSAIAASEVILTCFVFVVKSTNPWLLWSCYFWCRIILAESVDQLDQVRPAIFKPHHGDAREYVRQLGDVSRHVQFARFFAELVAADRLGQGEGHRDVVPGEPEDDEMRDRSRSLFHLFPPMWLRSNMRDRRTCLSSGFLAK